MKQKFLPCFQICYSQHRCIPARLPSSPLWAKDLEKIGKKSFTPYSKAGHQACGGVGFDNGKPFCVAVNLSAPLMCRAIGFFLYKASLWAPPCARRWRWVGLQRRCRPGSRPASLSLSDCGIQPAVRECKTGKRSRVEPRSRRELGRQGKWFCSSHPLRFEPHTWEQVW